MRIWKKSVLIILWAIITGCATDFSKPTRNIAFHDGQKLIAAGDYELGLMKLEQAENEEPQNLEIRSVLTRQRDVIIKKLFFEADNTRLSGDLDYAEQLYQRILDIVPHNQRVQTSLETLNQDRQHIAAIDYAQELLARNDLASAEATVRAVLQENPLQPQARQLVQQINARMIRTDETGLTLKTAFKKPLTIEFRDTDLKSVFELMSKTAGINFIFDKDIRKETKISIFVRDNSIEDVLKLLLMTNQLAYKKLNENSLLIYPNTPAKKKEYKELVIRSFHVAHTEVKQMVAMIRGLVKAKDIYVNEKLNLFIMRDTQEAIRLVERLVALNDLPEPEVMLDVQVIEIVRDSAIKLGPNLPQSITYRNVLDTAGNVLVPFKSINSTGAITAATAEGTGTGINQVTGLQNFGITNDILIDFQKNLRQGDILANPRIRVKNREQAKILIGNRVPIVTSNVTGTAATVSQQVNYIDVGLKFDVEPIISLTNEVSMKVLLEVSSISGFTEVPNGTDIPNVGTRTAETLLSLRDGETQVLAGLISDEERNNYAGIAGLIDLPILNKLFTGQNLEHKKTEIILLITPHIIRNNTRPRNLESEFSFGTANAAGKLPLKISKTDAQSLALSTSGSGRGARSVLGRAARTGFVPSQTAPNPFARNALATPVVTIAAPKNVGLDKEFSVRIRLAGAKASVAGELQMSYDSDMLELLDGGEKNGSRTLKLGKGEKSGMSAQLRFKVITANPGSTDIAVQSASAEDKESGETLDVTLPSAASINIQ